MRRMLCNILSFKFGIQETLCLLILAYFQGRYDRVREYNPIAYFFSTAHPLSPQKYNSIKKFSMILFNFSKKYIYVRQQ